MESDCSNAALEDLKKAKHHLNHILIGEDVFGNKAPKSNGFKKGREIQDFFVLQWLSIFRIHNDRGEWNTDHKEIADAGV